MSNYRNTVSNNSFGCLIYAGIIAGFIGALVKSGVETLLPPRLPSATPPPISLLELFGFNAPAMNYTFMEQSINWGGNGVHILFSIVIAIIYCVAVNQEKIFGILNGVVFGLVMGLGAHCIVLPIIGIGPAPWNISFQGYVSEVVGIMIWIWTIDAVRRRLLT